MTLNQLLVELDGFEQTTGIIVVAATNIPETLDKAITRPGRFDRKVLVDALDVKARKDMFDLYLKDRAASDVNIEDLAKSTQGFTGADISNMVNVAAIEATKRNLTKIPMSLIRSALDTVSMGPARKSLAMAPEIKKLTAYHEAGHALVGLYSPGGNEIIKATLVPRGHALGMVAWQPKDELLNTKQDFISQIDMCMGGRVAEELIFGPDKITPGAGSDLQHASKLARSMVLSLGMGERLGLQSFADAKSVSPDTARVAEQEVQDILQSAYNRAKIILTEHQKEHHALANALLEHETLTLDEIKMVISGKDLKSHFRNKKQEEQALRAKEDELYGALPSFPDALGASTKQPLAVETTPKDENKQQVLK
jgi:ATP-dependent metalloprotease